MEKFAGWLLIATYYYSCYNALTTYGPESTIISLLAIVITVFFTVLIAKKFNLTK